jgi:DNA-binding MarR family transcriptional regulator
MNEEVNVDVKRMMETFERFFKADWRKQSFLGIKPSEIRVLLCINNLSSYGQHGVKVSEISKKLSVTSPTITQMIKSLCIHGCIERTKDLNDRRIAYIKLTDRGVQIVEKALLRYKIIFSGVMDTLGNEQSKTLIKLLNQVYTYFDEASKMPDEW